MKIENIRQNHNINYQARKVAVSDAFVNGVKETIDIYAIEQKDCKFLKQVIDSVNVRRLAPNLAHTNAGFKWQGLVNDASMYLGELPDEHSFLAVKGRKACGILVGTDVCNHGFVESFVKWPTKKNEKTKGIGTSILTSFMDYISTTKAERITLEPMSGGPNDCVKFYKQQGFSFIDRNNSIMAINRYNMFKTLEANKKAINYRPQEGESVDIKTIIDACV